MLINKTLKYIVEHRNTIAASGPPRIAAPNVPGAA
jgi:hypothetical protein